MSLRQDLGHGKRIGRAEFVRSVRRYGRDTRRLLGLALTVLFFGGNLLVALPATYFLGRTARTMTSIPFFEPAATLLPVGILLVAAMRTMERIGGVDSEELLLTSVHPRAVVVGLITAEIARLLLWFGIPLAAAVGAFALGLGSPTLLITAFFVLLPVVCCTTVWGYAIGIGVLRLLKRLPTLRRFLKVGIVLVFLGFVFFSQVAARHLVAEGVQLSTLMDLLSFGPLTEYVALLFAGTPLARTVSMDALVVLVGFLSLTPIGLAVAERQAAALWFADDQGRDTSTKRSSNIAVSTGGFAPPRPFSWSKSGRIAWAILVRAVRKPQELSHLLMLVFFAGPLGGSFVQGSGGEGLALIVAGAGVVVGVYLSGATFGLNPLGDDRPRLPLILLTETDPRTFLRGRVLAGLAVGLPVATLVPLAALTIGFVPLYGLVFATVGCTLSVAAALLAPGLGCAYPIYEERKLWGAETVAPSMLVMMTFSFVVIVGTILGLVLTWYVLTGHIGVTALLLVGVGVYLLLTFGIPLAFYWYARGRYRRYVLD